MGKVTFANSAEFELGVENCEGVGKRTTRYHACRRGDDGTGINGHAFSGVLPRCVRIIPRSMPYLSRKTSSAKRPGCRVIIVR